MTTKDEDTMTMGTAPTLPIVYMRPEGDERTACLLWR